MTPQEALDHFKTQSEIAHVLECSPAAVTEWFKEQKIPDGRQYQLQLATKGVLKADLPADRRKGRKKPRPTDTERGAAVPQR